MFGYKSLAISFQSQAQPNKGVKKMFFTEEKTVGIEIEKLDELINEQALDGWELVAYAPVSSPEHVTFVVTFKKTK